MFPAVAKGKRLPGPWLAGLSDCIAPEQDALDRAQKRKGDATERATGDGEGIAVFGA